MIEIEINVVKTFVKFFRIHDEFIFVYITQLTHSLLPERLLGEQKPRDIRQNLFYNFLCKIERSSSTCMFYHK